MPHPPLAAAVAPAATAPVSHPPLAAAVRATKPASPGAALMDGACSKWVEWPEVGILYPAPKIRWFSNAEDHPSLFPEGDPHRLQKPDFPRRKPPQREADGGRVGGFLLVNVVSVSAPTPPGASVGRGFRATAFYPSERQDVRDSRMTQPQKASSSTSGSPSQESCAMDKQVSIPFNDREQFIKVAVYRSEEHGDSLIGEATVPIADPTAERDSPWPLLRDFVMQGTVIVSIQLPSSPPSETLSDAEASCRSASTTEYTTASSGSSLLASQCRVGDDLEVFSKGLGSWVSCHVAEADGKRATLVHGRMRRRINLLDEKLEDYLRLPAGRAEAGIARAARGGGA